MFSFIVVFLALIPLCWKEKNKAQLDVFKQSDIIGYDEVLESVPFAMYP